ncbi:hypothetical protein [Neoroseomonas rubea]|uniref:hypothetical protein n=1 Tax=Neoroseomonas rubea TaxID=2748666 RepID=UPI0018DF21CD|nr:hypothetical protein [Roseomonas rubea]
MDLSLALHELGHAVAMRAEGAGGLHLLARDDHYEVIADEPGADPDAAAMTRTMIAGPMAELSYRAGLDIAAVVQRVEAHGPSAFAACACSVLDLEPMNALPAHMTPIARDLLTVAAHQVAPVLSEGLAAVTRDQVMALARAIREARPGDRIDLPI